MKALALAIGIALLALGVACFIPGLAANGVLFGIFPASMPLAIAFIVTGAIGIMIGVTRRRDLTPRRGPGSDMRDLGL